MRRLSRFRLSFWGAASLFLLATTTLGAQEPRATVREEILVLSQQPWHQPVKPGQPVELAFRVGELNVVAAPIAEVRADLEIRCRNLSERRCAHYRDRLELKADTAENGAVRVALRGLSRWQQRRVGIDAHIRVPESSPLRLDIGVGDVDVQAGRKDLAVEMGIGDLHVLATQREVASVALRTKIGDAVLTGSPGHEDPVHGERLRLLGAHLRWQDGRGDAQIRIDLGIGDAEVELQ